MSAADQRLPTPTTPEGERAGEADSRLADVAEVPLRSIVEGMLEGVAFLDREWRFLYLNDAAARNLGGTRDELLGRSVFDHYPGLRGTPVHDRFARCLQDGQPQRFEAQFPSGDGSMHWFEFSVQPSIEGVLVLSLDVTDRRRAADADAMLRAALESIDLLAVILDLNGHVTFANDALLRATGWTCDEVAADDWFDRCLAPGDREAVQGLIDEATSTGSIQRRLGAAIVTRDGRQRTIVWNGTLLRDGTGTPVAIAAIGDDVTDRRAMEAAFLETSRSVTAALNASEDSIAIYRPVLDENGKFVDAEVVFANEATGTWLPHLDLSTVRGKRLFELAPEARPSVSALYAHVIETGRPVHVVRESILRPGPRVLDVTVTPYEDGFVHVGRDITELHRTEAELRAREDDLRRTINAVDAIIVWTSDMAGPLTVTPQVERILGWRPDQLTSFADWDALVHPDDLARCREEWDGDADSWSLQYRLRRADGTYATVADRGRRYAAPGGERGSFGVIVDVSERVAADAALAESEERLRQIIEGVEAIVGFQSPDGALQLSPQIERILGWRPDQVATFAGWRALVHPDDLAACAAVWDADVPTWQLEYRIRRADGAWAWLVDRGRKILRNDGSGTYTFGIMVDATERHHADEALRVSEERLRRTIESLDAVVAFQEHAGAPLRCSPQIERILGVPPSSVTAFADWNALVHPDDLPRCLAMWEDGPDQWEIEYRMRRPDGRDVWVLDRGRRIPSADGPGEGTFGVVVDVTDRHLAAEALRASEEQYRRIVENVDVIISYQEAEGTPVLVSRQAERILGYPAERIAKFEEWRAAIHPDDLPGCVATWASGVRGWDMEYRMRRADGQWIWVNDRGRRMPSADGSTRGLFGVITDITAQHEAADRLRASEGRFRAMFEENPEAIGVLRPLFSADGRFVDAEFLAANRTTRQRWLGGVPAELVPGLRASSLWFTGGESVRSAVAGVAERREAWRDEVRTRRDGVEAWTDLSVFPFEDGVAFVGRDVTDQRELAEQLRRSQRLEAVGQLAGGVAHDFNNLLAAIRGYGELAMAALPSNSPGRRDLEEVLRAADRASGLTRQLLLFSRREVLAPKLVDPAEVVDGLVPMLRQLVGEHIELVATGGTDHGMILADPGQLEQVFLNLIVNARDAMPGGGRIEVATSRVDPGTAAPGETPSAWPALRIMVRDSGSGIGQEVLPHIFEPFFTTKEAGRGSGMGLATVYGIVGASGGTVSVSSQPEKGTCFTIDLPFVEDAEAMPETTTAWQAAPRPTEVDGGGRQRAVLLVEDDVAVRSILGRMLASQGWLVTEQASGSEAAHALAAGELSQPDLLITDVRMPGLQGPDLARHLHESWPELPVLFITGLADEVGADPDEPWMRHVLTKPFDMETLRRSIEEVLGAG